MRLVDALLAALSKEVLDLVATVREGDGLLTSRLELGWGGRRR